MEMHNYKVLILYEDAPTVLDKVNMHTINPNATTKITKSYRVN